jgi:hypothetical protein
LQQAQNIFFAATAYDTDGYESDYSEEVICTIPAATDIQLLAPENGLTISDAPVFEWEAEDFDVYKIQISKDETRFFTIGFTREKSFKPQKFWINLIATDQVTPVYWRILGKKSDDKSWVASEAQMFYLVNNNYDDRKSLKEILREIFLLFK